MTTRRQFAFWITAGLFSLSERLGAEALDRLAAVAIECVERTQDGQVRVEQHRWSYREDSTWRWFERETLVEDAWGISGRTRPVHRTTGEWAPEQEGYLDESLVPDAVRFGTREPLVFDDTDEIEEDCGEVSPERRAREGRPPSRWLRRLYAEELRLWLPTIDVPTASVSGMTVWTHLTRDHGFDAQRIEGLEEAELAKLHAAAHDGY